MSEVIAFPLTHRVGFIRKQARVIAGMGREAGYRHIQRMLRLQINSMKRKGIAQHVIDQEITLLWAALESASNKARVAK